MIKAIKLKFNKLSKSKKIQLIAAVSFTVVLIASIPIFAWFTLNRGIAATTKINAPTKLYITSGNKEASANINMADIDVEEMKDSKRVLQKDYVVGIAGKNVGTYKLQLAHTTNIPFTYEIYKASETTQNGDVMYVGEDKEKYYYNKGAKVSGDYLNLGQDNLADNTLHNKSYGTYSNVQKNAEPLYWQSENLKAGQADSDGEFCDYYIITVTWTESAKNDKETDMVYLTAEAIS